MPVSWSLKLKQTLCCPPPPSWERRLEDAHQSGPVSQVAASWPPGWECWICSVLVYICPLLHSRLWDCCKETLLRRGRRCHHPHRSSLFFDHLHIMPPDTQPPTPPPPLSVRERETDICIASSYCTQFIWKLWVSVERAEEKIFLCRINLLFSVFFLSFKKKKTNSGKIGQIKCGGAITDHHGIGCCSMSICSFLGS